MFRVSDTHYAATWLLHPKAPKIGMPEELAKRVSRLLKDAKRMEEGQMSAEGIATGAMASEISRSEQLRKSKNHVQSAAADMTPEADHAAETETADALGDDAPGHPVKEVAV